MTFICQFPEDLQPLKEELERHGYSEITAVVNRLKIYDKTNFIALTNGELVFIILDQWHDQQLDIMITSYPLANRPKIGIEQMLNYFGLNGKYNFVELTSYYNQSPRELVLKQVSFLREILGVMKSNGNFLFA